MTRLLNNEYEIYCESKSDWFSANTERPKYEQNKA